MDLSDRVLVISDCKINDDDWRVVVIYNPEGPNGNTFIPDKNVRLLRVNTDYYCISMGDFHEGFASAELNKGMWNFMDLNGKLINKEVYEFVSDFKNGKALVLSKGMLMLINTDGKYVSDKGVYDTNSIDESFTVSKLKGKWYAFDRLNREFTDEVKVVSKNEFHDGFAKITFEATFGSYAPIRRSNFIDQYDGFLSNVWFADATDFKNGIATGYHQNGWRVLNTFGEFITKNEFSEVGDNIDGIIKVKFSDGDGIYGDRYNFLNVAEKKLISHIDFIEAKDFHGNYAKVKTPDENWHLLDRNGELDKD
jgi:hypothetical protein